MTTTAEPVVAVYRSALLLASETFIRNQAGALTRWRPAFVGATKVDSPIAMDTDIITYPGNRLGRTQWMLHRLTGRSARLRRVLDGIRPSLVHAHFGGDGWLVSHSAARHGVPLVLTLHGIDVTSQPLAAGPRGVRYRRNLRTAFGRAALILVVSGFIRDKAIALGADPAKVRVHHTGVPVPDSQSSNPAVWDVLFVGRFVEKKGIDDLIEALAMMPEPRPRALFIGSGPLEQSMRDRAAQLRLNATFLGNCDPETVRRCMSESKLFVSPSKTAGNGDAEGLPTTILEAASHGLPVVSTYHSGIPEAVVHGETGLLCAEGDRGTLAAYLTRLLADSEERARLGSQGRLCVERHFDIVTQTRRLEDLYDSAAGLIAR